MIPITQNLQLDTYKGALKPVIELGKSRFRVLRGDHLDIAENPIKPNPLIELEGHIVDHCKDESSLAIYKRVIGQLNRLMIVAYGGGMPRGDTGTEAQGQGGESGKPLLMEAWDVILWQFFSGGDFLPLLQKPEPEKEAVAIYAHYLAVMRFSESHWWLEGWANRLMARVWDCLDDETRLWITWPIEEMGWVPPRNSERR